MLLKSNIHKKEEYNQIKLLQKYFFSGKGKVEMHFGKTTQSDNILAKDTVEKRLRKGKKEQLLNQNGSQYKSSNILQNQKKKLLNK